MAGVNDFAFPSLPAPQPMPQQNPLIQKARVVDRSSPAAGPSLASAPAPAAPPAAAPQSTAAVAAPTRKKIPFEKGYSQMDWVRLTHSGADLTGLGQGARPRSDVTMEEVAQHCSEEDGWTVLRGRVYNLTPYLRFHPGGVSILKAILGKDGTALFNKYHAWVNSEFLLAKCLVGTLGEGSSSGSGRER